MRSITAILILAASTPASRCLAASDDLEKVMHAWCTQAGTWTGSIDVTGADGKTARLELVSKHDCTEGSKVHIVRERFGTGASTVKVTFIDPEAGNFHTSYISGARDKPYGFEFVSVEMRDDAHWKTVIASTPGSETYEGRPAILRYIRVRDGDQVESWKDVQFADGRKDFEPRSRIVQTLRP
jgi:hypothetical protein